MANEILILEELDRGEGRDRRRQYTAIFFYPIDPVIEVGSANVVAVPAPSSQMPALVQQFGLLSQTELDAVDAGRVAWEVVTLVQAEGESAAQLAARAQVAWEKREAEHVPSLRKRYARTGARLNVARRVG